MNFIAFIFKGMVKLTLLGALAIGGVFAYTEYAKTYGIVKFKNGGYLVFDAPQNSYILEQSKIILRMARGATDYEAPASIIESKCDETCVLANQSAGMVAVDAQSMTSVPSRCTGGQDVNVGALNKRAIVCMVNGPTYSSLSSLYEVAPNKVASIVMGVSRQVAGHDPNFIRNNQSYIADIINSSEYRDSIWPTFGWVRDFLPAKGTQP